MVAIGILGIGLLIVAASFPVAIDQARQAVEITNAQLVFEEAAQRLKLDVGPGRLDDGVPYEGIEDYVNADGSDGAYRGRFRLGADDTQRRVYLLSFDTVPLDPNGSSAADFFDGGFNGDPELYPFSGTDCVYSVDDTYGWVAAVQKQHMAGAEPGTATGKSRYYYKFWVFVVREPTGVSDGTNLKMALRRAGATPFGVGATRQLRLLEADVPGRGSFLLGDDGEVYKVTDVGTPSGGYQLVMCDKDVSGIDESVAFVDVNPDASGNLTRRAPVVAVYETVINYDE